MDGDDLAKNWMEDDLAIGWRISVSLQLHIFTVSLQWGFQNRGSVCVTLFILALNLDAELWICDEWILFGEEKRNCESVWISEQGCTVHWLCLDFENKVCESVIVNGLRENWVLILKMVCLFSELTGQRGKHYKVCEQQIN